MFCVFNTIINDCNKNNSVIVLRKVSLILIQHTAYNYTLLHILYNLAIIKLYNNKK